MEKNNTQFYRLEKFKDILPHEFTARSKAFLLCTGFIIAMTLGTGCGEFEERKITDPIYPNEPRSVSVETQK